MKANYDEKRCCWFFKWVGYDLEFLPEDGRFVCHDPYLVVETQDKKLTVDYFISKVIKELYMKNLLCGRGFK